MMKFICQHCGREKPWEERDYDMGLYLAQVASYEALGHTECMSPYLVCEQCSEEIKEGWRKMTQFDENAQ